MRPDLVRSAACLCDFEEMPVERIMIIGGNGAGKTTFSEKLRDQLQLPLVHLDALYWRDNWQAASHEEFDALLMRELVKPRWIMDGNMHRTIPMRLPYCDTVIYMDYSTLRCVCGVIKRSVQNHGKSRPDMGGYCLEKFDRRTFSFIRSVWQFNKKNRKRYYEMLDEACGAEIIILKNRRQTKAFLLRTERTDKIPL